MKEETFYFVGAMVLGAGLAIRLTLYCLAIWYLFHGNWQNAIGFTAISELLLLVLNNVKKVFD